MIGSLWPTLTQVDHKMIMILTLMIRKHSIPSGPLSVEFPGATTHINRSTTPVLRQFFFLWDIDDEDY